MDRIAFEGDECVTQTTFVRSHGQAGIEGAWKRIADRQNRVLEEQGLRGFEFERTSWGIVHPRESNSNLDCLVVKSRLKKVKSYATV